MIQVTENFKKQNKSNLERTQKNPYFNAKRFFRQYKVFSDEYFKSNNSMY